MVLAGRGKNNDGGLVLVVSHISETRCGAPALLFEDEKLRPGPSGLDIQDLGFSDK